MFDQSTQEVNNKKLFVGNLPFSMGQSDIEELFSQYGETKSVQLITDRMTKRSKGFAFVEYLEESMAQDAIDALHESEVEGRKIIVNIARPLKKRAPRRNHNSYSDRSRNF